MTLSDRGALARLAEAHGVATTYEGHDRAEVAVDDAVVVAVLAQLGVDAADDAAVARGIADVEALPRDRLPGTIALTPGRGRPIGAATGVLHLEDGGRLDVTGELPSDLPLGWHRLDVEDRSVTVVVAPERLPEVPRTWGWMLQLYALHSAGSWGMGDYGDLAEVARRAGRDQGAGVLLVSPVQAFVPSEPLVRSPYSPASRRFASPLYLRVTDLPEYRDAAASVREAVDALAPADSTAPTPSGADGPGLVDHDAVWHAKRAALELLWENRRPAEQDPVDRPDDEPVSLSDPAGPDGDEPDLLAHATWAALTERHGADWRTWPDELRDPRSEAVAVAATGLGDRVAFHAWLQQRCRQQLDAARAAAREAGMAVGLVHDLPVGVHPGGADAWAQQDVFAGEVRVGCPADAFNPLGQDWGLPPWRPDALDAAGYAPFRDVVRSVLRHGDGIRVDHVAGLWRLWWIPPGEPAHRGTYVHYDADVMLAVLALEAHRAGAIVVAEDLGVVEDVVTETLHARGMLASAVLWFERDWDADGQPHVPPREWEPETMASISTHDLPTIAGWVADERVRVQHRLGLLEEPLDAALTAAAADRDALVDLLRHEGIDADDLVVALHAVVAPAASRLVLSSPADAVGQVDQPNLPGTVDEYPNWRVPLPVPLEDFFDDPRVAAAVAPLRTARPATSPAPRSDL